MNHSSAMSAPRARLLDRLARRAESILRRAAGPRLALVLLLVAGAWNAMAAALSDGRRLLEGPAYPALLAAIVLAGLATLAVRLPAAWREWRTPSPIPAADTTLIAELPLGVPAGPAVRATAREVLAGAGYRISTRGGDARWAVTGVRHGWARIVSLASHLAVLGLVVGAAGTAAFSSERTFSLLPGDEAFLGDPGSGQTDAIRLERFEAAFGPQGQPQRLDTTVTFLRGGAAVETTTLEVNRPGDFGGYQVHGWTYGPAARLRVTTLGGRPMLDAALALDGTIRGRPGAYAELPGTDLALGAMLADTTANQLAVGAASPGGGLVDRVTLGPGETRRVGDLLVAHRGLTSYVTFLARNDPGASVVFASGTLLVVGLAVSLWLPRRRATIRVVGDALELTVRGDAFDRPVAELALLRTRLATAVAGG